MRRFHCPDLPRSGEAVLSGDECRHLAGVIRARPGDRVGLFDGEGREVEAEVVEVGFPTLDGSDKSPAYMTIQIDPERVQYKKGDGSQIAGTLGPATKKWLCSNFRFEIGDLPVDRVSKIDSITWKQKIAKDEADLEVTLSSADLSTWERWHRGFYIIDRSVPRSSSTPDARLVWLGPDGNEELASLEFHEVTYSSLTIDGDTNSSTDAHAVSIELSGGRLSLKR